MPSSTMITGPMACPNCRYQTSCMDQSIERGEIQQLARLRLCWPGHSFGDDGTVGIPISQPRGPRATKAAAPEVLKKVF